MVSRCPYLLTTRPNGPRSGATVRTSRRCPSRPHSGGERTTSRPPALTLSTSHLLLVDLQKDFCLPEGALFVGGRSGAGAIDDTRRTAEFIYRNLARLKRITVTMDTHHAFQIFFPSFWVDRDGGPVSAHTTVSADDVRAGRLLPNQDVAWWVCGGDVAWLAKQALFYCEELERAGKYTLYLWPPHCILGSDGHALVGSIQEARMFHSFARGSQSWAEVKGDNALTENYSVLRPEVMTRHDLRPLAPKNTRLVETLLAADAVIVAGQAASHCVRSTLEDLLEEILARDPALARKVYVLEDCMSAVAIPDGRGGFLADFTTQADEALARFAESGMHVVRSTDPISAWPEFRPDRVWSWWRAYSGERPRRARMPIVIATSATSATKSHGVSCGCGTEMMLGAAMYRPARTAGINNSLQLAIVAPIVPNTSTECCESHSRYLHHIQRASLGPVTHLSGNVRVFLLRFHSRSGGSNGQPPERIPALDVVLDAAARAPSAPTGGSRSRCRGPGRRSARTGRTCRACSCRSSRRRDRRPAAEPERGREQLLAEAAVDQRQARDVDRRDEVLELGIGEQHPEEAVGVGLDRHGGPELLARLRPAGVSMSACIPAKDADDTGRKQTPALPAGVESQAHRERRRRGGHREELVELAT